MKKYLFAVIVFAAVSEAQVCLGGLCLSRQRAFIVAPRAAIVVAPPQAIVLERERVRLGFISSPLVQVTDLRFTAPLTLGYAAPAQDTSRLDRLERSVERLAEQQAALIQALKAPK